MPRTPADPTRAANNKSLRQQAGRWLKKAREAAGLTQPELARQLGLRYYTFVSQVEGGVSRVPIGLQGRWSLAVGIAPAQFARTLLRFYEPELYRLLFVPTEAGPDLNLCQGHAGVTQENQVLQPKRIGTSVEAARHHSGPDARLS